MTRLAVCWLLVTADMWVMARIHAQYRLSLLTEGTAA